MISKDDLKNLDKGQIKALQWAKSEGWKATKVRQNKLGNGRVIWVVDIKHGNAEETIYPGGTDMQGLPLRKALEGWWVDPAGGVHPPDDPDSDDFYDPAAMYENKLQKSNKKRNLTAEQKIRKMIRTEIKKVLSEESEIISFKVKDGKYTDEWFLKKIDSTHFYFANNKDALVNGAAMAHHVNQHRQEPYYSDIRKWLKTGEFTSGKTY